MLNAPRLILLSICLFVLSTAVYTCRRLRPPVKKSKQKTDLSMDFLRQPYLHRNPDGIRFGHEARLLHYRLSADTMEPGSTLTVTLFWDVTTNEPLQARVRLLSPAKPVFDKSTFEVLSKVTLESTQTIHQLAVPPYAVSGPYLLMVELRDADTAVIPLTSGGTDLGRVYLQPVWARSSGHRAPDRQPVARFGDRIVLVDARTERSTSDRLYIRLIWQALQPVPANYNLSLRLIDASGLPVSVRDLQPHYGFYPTSLWPPGEAVEDVLSLPIPQDTPPGNGFTLELILYSLATLDPIGQAAVDVQLTG
jgi:hypothetical protein